MSFPTFRFFTRLFHVRLHRLLFLYFANLLLHNLVHFSSSHSLEFSLLDGLVFSLTILSFLLFYKSYVLSNMAENRAVIVSIYILNPPSIILHLPALFCSIYSSSFPYTMVLFLSIVCLLRCSSTTYSFPFFPYLHSITLYEICEYGFFNLLKKSKLPISSGTQIFIDSGC